MVDLRSRTHGPGAMRAVNLVVLAYDDRVVARTADEDAVHYLDARVHPGDRRAPGQISLALVSKKDGRSTSGHENSARYSAEQFASIERAAGENRTPLRDAAGSVVGTVFGVSADLLIQDGAVVLNTKTLGGTELSVGADAEGRDIRAQMVASTRSARRARDAAQAQTPPLAAEELALR